jgi:hypothetical protein
VAAFVSTSTVGAGGVLASPDGVTFQPTGFPEPNATAVAASNTSAQPNGTWVVAAGATAAQGGTLRVYFTQSFQQGTVGSWAMTQPLAGTGVAALAMGYSAFTGVPAVYACGTFQGVAGIGNASGLAYLSGVAATVPWQIVPGVPGPCMAVVVDSSAGQQTVYVATAQGVYRGSGGQPTSFTRLNFSAGNPEARSLALGATGPNGNGLLFAGTTQGVFRADVAFGQTGILMPANAGIADLAVQSLLVLPGTTGPTLFAGTAGRSSYRSTTGGR